jgi:hypothetical protein
MLCLLPKLTTFGAFYPVLIAYCATYVPTLALVTCSPFIIWRIRSATSSSKRLGRGLDRGWRTLSVAQGRAIGRNLSRWRHPSRRIVLAHTADTLPRKTGRNVSLGEILGLDALAPLKKPSFATSCMFHLHPALFLFREHEYDVTNWAELYRRENVSRPVSDVIFPILLPLMLKNLLKKTIFIGILAW